MFRGFLTDPLIQESPDPLGTIGLLRFNQLQPPFNNEKMRQAFLYAVDQREYMAAVAGDPENWRTCYSFFTCGTALAPTTPGQQRSAASATSRRRKS